MTSKNSFWKLSAWNLKKRSWLFAVSCCLWLFALPLYTFLNISSLLEDYKQTVTSDPGTWQMVKVMIWQSNVVSNLHVIISIGLAILMAIQAFSWVNNKQKVDMYKSVPVKESTRFVYISLNSLFMFVLPMLVGFILTNIIIWANGFYEPEFFTGSLMVALICTITYIGVYATTLIAVLLTGNIVLAFFGSLFLLFFEPVLRVICWMFKSTFYTTMTMDFSSISAFSQSLTSPAVTGMSAFNAFRSEMGGPLYESYYFYRLGIGLKHSCAVYILTCVIQCVALLALAYFLYKKRAAQTGGKSIVFSKVTPFIKFAIILSFSMGIGYIMSSVFTIEGEIAFGLFGIILTTILLHIILGAVIEGDLNEAVKKTFVSLPVSILAGGMACAIFLIYALDLFGYNSYLPSESELESFAFVRDTDNLPIIKCDYANGVYNTLGAMKIDDANAKKVLLESLQEAIANNEYCGYNEYTDLTDIALRTDFGIPDDLVLESMDRGEGVQVAYHLTNGKTVVRRYYLKEQVVRKIFARIYDLPEYKKYFNPLNYDEVQGLLTKAEKGFDDCIYEDFSFNTLNGRRTGQILTIDQLKAVCEALKDDVNERTYADLLKGASIGKIFVSAPVLTTGHNWISGDSREDVSFHVSIYECDERTIAVLKELGLYRDIAIPTEDVRAINVFHYDEENYPDEYTQRKIVLNPDDALAKMLMDNAFPSEAMFDALDASVLDLENYFMEVISEDGTRVQYSLYQKDFLKEQLGEAMKDAPICTEEEFVHYDGMCY